MSGYEIRRVHNPPVIVARDGRFYVQLTDGGLTLEAEVGVWFISRVFELAVMPLLKEKP